MLRTNFHYPWYYRRPIRQGHKNRYLIVPSIKSLALFREILHFVEKSSPPEGPGRYFYFFLMVIKPWIQMFSGRYSATAGPGCLFFLKLFSFPKIYLRPRFSIPCSIPNVLIFVSNVYSNYIFGLLPVVNIFTTKDSRKASVGNPAVCHQEERSDRPPNLYYLAFYPFGVRF